MYTQLKQEIKWSRKDRGTSKSAIAFKGSPQLVPIGVTLFETDASTLAIRDNRLSRVY